MAFTAIAPAEVAPDQPVSTTLMDKIRTNFDDHEARILASASGGSIGEVLNGSFETAQGGNPNWPDKWAIAQYSGGQVILDAASTTHGKKSLKMMHTVSGGGGGYAESDYVAVSSLYTPPLNFAYYCSYVGVQVQVWARYYAADANGDPSTYLGERMIYSNPTSNPTTWSACQIYNVPLAFNNARYVKYRFIGGVNGTTQTGTVWFDAVGVPIRRVVYPLDNPNPINQMPVVTGNYNAWANIGTTWNVTIPVGSWRWMVIRGALYGAYGGTDDWGGQIYSDPYARFYISGTGRYSTIISQSWRSSIRYAYSLPAWNDTGSWTWMDMVADITGLAGTYTIGFQGYYIGNIWNSYGGFQCPTLAGWSKHYLTGGFIAADGTILTYTDVYNSVPLW